MKADPFAKKRLRCEIQVFSLPQARVRAADRTADAVFYRAPAADMATSDIR